MRCFYEGIAVNSTAQLDLSGENPQVIGNPTEGALLSGSAAGEWITADSDQGWK